MVKAGSQKTIFERVIHGELEGSFVHQDEFCVAFMDLHPLNAGHVLVVPRTPAQRLRDLQPEIAGHLMKTAQKILKAIEESSLPCEGANLFIADGDIAGQEVPHVHMHIIPRFSDDGIHLSFGKSHRKESRAELNKAAELIKTSLLQEKLS